MIRQPAPPQPQAGPGCVLFVLAFFCSPFVLLAWVAGQALLRAIG
jgi:hypothetical protein